MAEYSNPVCVAIDTTDVAAANDLIDTLAPHIGMVKIGMEFFYANGHSAYEKLAAKSMPVFLDLKLHDIPNTVAAGLNSLMQLNPEPAIVNIHTTGGPAMMEAAARAVNGRAKLIGVTILTSLDDNDLRQCGFTPSMNSREHAVNLARLAKECGLDGVVCSSHDISSIKQACGEEFLTVVPGIRPQTSAANDQKRMATPVSAMASGADILVIGRPITKAIDPALAAKNIYDSLK